MCTFLVWIEMLRHLTSELIVHISGVDGHVETLNQFADCAHFWCGLIC